MKKILILLFVCSTVFAQTIKEKKESFQRNDSEMDQETLEQLHYINQELDEKRFELKQLYDQALQLYHTHAGKEHYDSLLFKTRKLKEEISEIQKLWRLETASFISNDEYALWHQPDTTLQQIVMDYGSADYIYFVPPEVGGIRLSLNSSVPIPREAWAECLELILAQYGIGIRELNPFIRELYIMRNDPSGIRAIVDQAQQLDFFPSSARICFILSPDATDPRSDLLFLQKFSNPLTTKIDIISGKIFITASVETIQEILKLYSFAKSGNSGQDFQLVTLSKLSSNEMETILNSAFHDGKVTLDSSTLRVIPIQSLSQSLFLTGSKEDVRKAQKLIQDMEAQIEDPQEKTVFWYTTKHSDAEELASVLAKVYDLLEKNEISSGAKKEIKNNQTGKQKEEKLAVSPSSISSNNEKRTSHKTADGQNNFIVDPKTGAIIMVVKQEALPKIKELLKKLDVPKKMVQIEVLLLEKRVSNSNTFGLNLLRLGSEATQKTATGLSFLGGPGAGILEFLISRSKGSGIPAYDLAYQFMLGQEDVQINASPSVTTINQTPATIAIVEEISIDSGADEKKNRIYNRAQYGIILNITPTINIDEVKGENFITLDTDITFDTPKKNVNDRPDVSRRHIKNHVRIADGQTVILGGLRRKSSQDSKDSIPFLGEIPGIGKLFSHTQMEDNCTEMFVFITPKIISDSLEDAERIKREELKKRPGDIPEFLHELVLAQDFEKKRLFEKSLTALFGQRCDKKTASLSTQQRGEYDGR